MKPISIALSILIGIASLSLLAWISSQPSTKTTAPEVEPKPTTPDHLPVPATGPYGKAEINETTFDFGIRLVGTDDEHNFHLKNVGEGKLVYELGKPTCQCTGVEVTDEKGQAVPDGKGEIAPGESITILVKWTMKSRMELFRHGVKIFTTDPDQRTIDLAVTGKVNTAYFVRPEGVWELGDMLTNAPTKAEGTITSPIYDSFTLEELPRDNPHVKVTISPIDPNHQAMRDSKSGYQLQVAAGPEVPPGIFRESIKLKAAHGDSEQTLEFTVYGRRNGPIEVRGVSPMSVAMFNSQTNRLLFKDFPATESRSVKLTLFPKGMENEDLILKSVEPADERFKISLHEGKTLGKSKSYLLEIEILPGPPGMRRGDDAQLLHLVFNHPEAPDFALMLDYNAQR